MATCVDVSGAAYPQQVESRPVPPMEGTGLAAVLGGGELTTRVLFWEHEGNRAVRDNNWKLVSVSGGLWELYDLSTDRVESKDLAAQRPERVKELEEAYQSWAERCGVLPYPAATRGG